ncbi:MAG: helix-turn-helix domain-containing protein, partial [Bacteroidales bacterium]|nr:helix-turn-helix domain-containing protein [Bacteroidales bacterium]
MKNNLSDELDGLEAIRSHSSSPKVPIDFKTAAQRAGLKESYMYKLTSQRKIPYYKPFGKRIYFDEDELTQWLLRNR